MKLESTFRIPVERERVFTNFLDAEIMRQAVPGCSRLDKSGDTHFSGRLSNTIAHVRFEATFAAEITSLVSPSQIVAVLSGEDRRLASTLRLDAGVDFRDDDTGTIVSYTIEMAMWGKLGRMGEAIFRRRTVEVEKQFVESFTRLCRGELVASAAVDRTDAGAQVPAAQPSRVPAGSLMGRAAPFITRRPSDIAAVGAEPSATSRPSAPSIALGPQHTAAVSAFGVQAARTLTGLLVGAAAGYLLGRRERGRKRSRAQKWSRRR